MNVSEIAGQGLSMGMGRVQATVPPGDDAGLGSPRALEPGCARQFRELLSATPCAAAAEGQAVAIAAPTAPPASFDLDIEKMVLSNLPAANATPAEFALGMLRAQVKVAQAAVGIELVAKTTQSLSQGVQTLTSRG